ncbi:ankyrin repeat domain-containing protein 53 [Parambassis ranga]|uniref:Ankyrin repeat domain-containing protein 53 n=1 Tax=Parambassis ranga TaxID=210632 RepID=A0A6P7KDR7_9TELE|nr:ankyrin repeat domain-containing protein 53 [Parambassis ranga]XP_028285532.1 ankyrin repeat domain-containing protein 53 [Parambassis ranga]
MFPAVAAVSPERSDVSQHQSVASVNRRVDAAQGLSALHVACIYGQPATVQLLVESRPGLVNCSDSQGRRPIHVVLSSQSASSTSACLRHLLEHEADVNATTDFGETPLHLAASEGLLNCVEMLVKAGADVLAKNGIGHTPLDLARIWCRRKVARYLKSCMWQADKKREMEERKQAQVLYRELVDMVKQNKKKLADEKMEEWANKKGLPPLKDFTPRVKLSQYHAQCLKSDQSSFKPSHTTAQPGVSQEDTASMQRRAATPGPWTIYIGLQSAKPATESDLRNSVSLCRNSSTGRPQYITEWDRTPRPTPHLPLDVLERVLFPRAFPPRIASSEHFFPRDILEVQHRGLQVKNASSWTEVAMHLAEVLESGHY